MAAQIKYEDKPWLAHYERGVPENIDHEQITRPEYLENSARQYPERIDRSRHFGRFWTDRSCAHYPCEIEEVLYRHPKIKEVSAIGLPHPSRGEQIKLFVVPTENVSLATEELIEYCQTRLADYKLPTQFEFRKDLPKSDVGKILKKVLREAELQK